MGDDHGLHLQEIDFTRADGESHKNGKLKPERQVTGTCTRITFGSIT